nr:MAG TPA: GABH AIV/GABH BLL coil heterodimer, DE NOVO.9A [Caudoviricetes sp.]
MSTIAELEDKVKELMDEIETLKQQEKTEKFEYPFYYDEDYWLVKETGEVKVSNWDTVYYDQPRYDQGHIFKTEQEAIRERDKRALLTRFRQFRDKCNGDWKPDWKSVSNGGECYSIDLTYHDGKAKLGTDWHRYFHPFCLFGYFKEQKDVERAIELFGDEIIRLWVEK